MYTANAYAARKDKSYNAIIKANNLDLHYKSVTFGTFGSFGTGTWAVITKACDSSTHPKGLDDFNPWNAPGPRALCPVPGAPGAASTVQNYKAAAAAVPLDLADRLADSPVRHPVFSSLNLPSVERWTFSLPARGTLP